MQDIRQNCGRLFVFFILLPLLYSCSHVPGTAHAAGSKKFSYFESLEKRLINDGFDKNGIRKLYRSPRTMFESKGVSLYFVHNEGKLNYDQFLENAPIRKARNYMEEQKNELTAAENAYGVDRQVITAILLVETRLGSYVGERFVFNSLSTMAALADTEVRKRLWKRVSGTTHLSKQAFEKKAARKSNWAYKELKAFLTYTDREKLDPLEIYGSYAGAMGLCQFMPSNILKLAKDGNKDGRINLFNHADAIMSVASYLNHNGWYPGIDRQRAYDVVYTYNHSSYYVNTILKIVEILKG